MVFFEDSNESESEDIEENSENEDESDFWNKKSKWAPFQGALIFFCKKILKLINKCIKKCIIIYYKKYFFFKFQKIKYFYVFIYVNIRLFITKFQ